MGWLSALCLWTTTHLPSPIYASKSLHASEADTLSLPVVFQSLTFSLFFFTFTFLTNAFLFAAVAVAHAVMFCHVQWQRNDAGPISRPLDGKHGKEIKAFIEMIYEFLHSEMQISV